MPVLSANAKYIAVSLARLLAICALFFASLAVAYMVGSILVELGVVPCSDAKACAMVPAFLFMPLGGPALYLISLVTWSLLARGRENGT